MRDFTFWKEKETSYYYARKITPASWRSEKVLWLGFYPKKNEKKYDYNWVGSTAKRYTDDEISELFQKYARYTGHSYSFRGMEHKTIDGLMGLMKKTLYKP